jgi:hypothetical protein
VSRNSEPAGAITSVAEDMPDAKIRQSRGCAGLRPRTGGAPLRADGVRLGEGYGIDEWAKGAAQLRIGEASGG